MLSASASGRPKAPRTISSAASGLPTTTTATVASTAQGERTSTPGSNSMPVRLRRHRPRCLRDVHGPLEPAPRRTLPGLRRCRAGPARARRGLRDGRDYGRRRRPRRRGGRPRPLRALPRPCPAPPRPPWSRASTSAVLPIRSGVTPPSPGRTPGCGSALRRSSPPTRPPGRSAAWPPAAPGRGRRRRSARPATRAGARRCRRAAGRASGSAVDVDGMAPIGEVERVRLGAGAGWPGRSKMLAAPSFTVSKPWRRRDLIRGLSASCSLLQYPARLSRLRSRPVKRRYSSAVTGTSVGISARHRSAPGRLL